MLGKTVSLFLAILFALIFALLCKQAAYAESQVVSATGVAPFTPGNEAKARDVAIQDAMRKAVEQAVGTMVAAETMVENYQLVRDSVLTKTQGYIQKYDVVSAGPKGNIYEVTISAAVAVENLKNDLSALGLLHARVEKPRVLFMIAEQNIGQEYYIFWWYGKSEFKGQQFDMSASETTLKEEFINNGFNIVDISVATGKIDISNAYRIADLTDAGAKEIGRKLGAEVVIKGKALAKAGPRTSGSSVGSYLADITASAIRVDNGAVLASARGHGVSRHISEVTGGTEALERAAREVSGKLIDQITAKWTQEVQAGGLIQITVRGIEEYSDLANFKDTIKAQIRGVNVVYQRSVEGGVAVIEVDYKGNAQQLADEITKKKFTDIPKLKVTSATANTMEITFGGTGTPQAKAPETSSSQPVSGQQPVSETQSSSTPLGKFPTGIEGEIEGIKVDITELKFSDGVITLRFVMINESDQKLDFGYKFGARGNDYNTMADVYLLDPVGSIKYDVGRDANGRPICSVGLNPLNQKGRIKLWVKLLVPQDKVPTKMTVVIPHFEPIENVGVSR
ncbi:MAG TPA: hypothetical protein VJ202_05475 [Thermodesulfobacteriota bacterium]|nr:hypothetical protein [Thermodesulfobacteriota bacterium]